MGVDIFLEGLRLQKELTHIFKTILGVRRGAYNPHNVAVVKGLEAKRRKLEERLDEMCRANPGLVREIYIDGWKYG